MNQVQINFTFDNKTKELVLPCEPYLTLEEFLVSLQQLLKGYAFNKYTTFDVYTEQFERIALVGDNNEIILNEEYSDFIYLQDFINEGIESFEVIALGTRSPSKVYQEEQLLQNAFELYEKENN